MVLAVMPRPPQRASLTCGTTQHGHHELGDSPYAVRPMREVSVIDSRDEEHAQDVKRHGDTERRRTDAGEDYCKAREVDSDERDSPIPVDVSRFSDGVLIGQGRVVRKPHPHFSKPANFS